MARSNLIVGHSLDHVNKKPERTHSQRIQTPEPQDYKVQLIIVIKHLFQIEYNRL